MAWGRTASSYTKTSKWRRSGRAQHSLLPLICYRRECATRHFTRRAASITLSGKIVDISFALPKPTTLEECSAPACTCVPAQPVATHKLPYQLRSPSLPTEPHLTKHPHSAVTAKP